MSMHLDTAAGLVRSAASSAGIALTMESEAKAAAELAPLLVFDLDANAYIYTSHTADTIQIVDGRAVDVPIGAFITSIARRFGSTVEPKAPPPASPSRFTGQTAAALARVANGATVAQTAHDSEQVAYARRLAAGPNPFLATGNQTHRALIRKYLPDVAAQLQEKVI